MQRLLYLLAVLAGLSNPIQSAANAGLNKGLGQVAAESVVIYGVGILALLLCTPSPRFSLRDLGTKLSAVLWWAWSGGLCSLSFVISGGLDQRRLLSR